MIINGNVTKVDFTELNVRDYVVADAASGTYLLTVREQLYTKEGLVVSTIVRIDKKLCEEPLRWQCLGFGIITSVRKGYSAVFAKAAGYKYPFLHTSWVVRSLTLYYNPRPNTQALR